LKPTTTRSPVKKPVIFNVYDYKPKTSEEHKNECNSGLHDLLNGLEYRMSRGLHSLLSSKYFKDVQDKYQLPTAFDSKEKYAKDVAFAVGCDYLSSIHVDDDYYYTSLSCVYEIVNDEIILFYFCFPTYGMAFPMYS
jgi:hypothetical protein